MMVDILVSFCLFEALVASRTKSCHCTFFFFRSCSLADQTYHKVSCLLPKSLASCRTVYIGNVPSCCFEAFSALQFRQRDRPFLHSQRSTFTCSILDASLSSPVLCLLSTVMYRCTRLLPWRWLPEAMALCEDARHAFRSQLPSVCAPSRYEHRCLCFSCFPTQSFCGKSLERFSSQLSSLC